MDSKNTDRRNTDSNIMDNKTASCSKESRRPVFIVAASDSHGMSSRLRELEQAYPQADYYLFTGDLSDPAFRHDPWISIQGNNDRNSILPEQKIVETPYGGILLIHGHQFPLRLRKDRIRSLAKEAGCRAAIYGHTHIPEIDQEKDIFVLNPGSLYRSRTEGGPGYALIRMDEHGIQAKLLKYHDLKVNGVLHPDGFFTQMPDKTKEDRESGHNK